MKHFLRHLFSRNFLVILALIFSLIAYLAIFEYALDSFHIVYLLLQIFSIYIAISIINKPMNTSFKLSWIVFVLAIPIFGALLYFILTSSHETRKYQKTFLKQSENFKQYGKVDDQVSQALKEHFPEQSPFAQFISHEAGYAIHGNTEASFYPSGEAWFPELLEELKKAEKYIFMEYFIVDFGYMWDSILEILKEKAKQGVEVRFMYDGNNSISLLPYTYYKTLESYGIKAKVFSQFVPTLSSVQDNRDHRKITVIDGKVAFTGGANLADEYINHIKRFGYWKDAAIKIKGEAVLSFTHMFLEMWNYDLDTVSDDHLYLEGIQNQKLSHLQTDSFYLPYGESPFDHKEIARRVYLELIQSAKDYIYIMTPYLVLDDQMIDSICYAAKRGVDVRVVTPGIYDKAMPYLAARTDFKTYLDAGIKLYEYTPGFTHAKLVLVDDLQASVGTVNMDYRSLFLNFECGVYILNDKAVLESIKKDLLEAMQDSHQVTQENFAQYPLSKRILGAAVKIIAPLF